MSAPEEGARRASQKRPHSPSGHEEEPRPAPAPAPASQILNTPPVLSSSLVSSPVKRSNGYLVSFIHLSPTPTPARNPGNATVTQSLSQPTAFRTPARLAASPAAATRPHPLTSSTQPRPAAAAAPSAGAGSAVINIAASLPAAAPSAGAGSTGVAASLPSVAQPSGLTPSAQVAANTAARAGAGVTTASSSLPPMTRSVTWPAPKHFPPARTTVALRAQAGERLRGAVPITSQSPSITPVTHTHTAPSAPAPAPDSVSSSLWSILMPPTPPAKESPSVLTPQHATPSVSSALPLAPLVMPLSPVSAQPHPVPATHTDSSPHAHNPPSPSLSTPPLQPPPSTAVHPDTLIAAALSDVDESELIMAHNALDSTLDHQSSPTCQNPVQVSQVSSDTPTPPPSPSSHMQPPHLARCALFSDQCDSLVTDEITVDTSQPVLLAPISHAHTSSVTTTTTTHTAAAHTAHTITPNSAASLSVRNQPARPTWTSDKGTTSDHGASELSSHPAAVIPPSPAAARPGLADRDTLHATPWNPLPSAVTPPSSPKAPPGPAPHQQTVSTAFVAGAGVASAGAGGAGAVGITFEPAHIPKHMNVLPLVPAAALKSAPAPPSGAWVSSPFHAHSQRVTAHALSVPSTSAPSLSGQGAPVPTPLSLRSTLPHQVLPPPTVTEYTSLSAEQADTLLPTHAYPSHTKVSPSLTALVPARPSHSDSSSMYKFAWSHPAGVPLAPSAPVQTSSSSFHPALISPLSVRPPIAQPLQSAPSHTSPLAQPPTLAPPPTISRPSQIVPSGPTPATRRVPARPPERASCGCPDATSTTHLLACHAEEVSDTHAFSWACSCDTCFAVYIEAITPVLDFADCFGIFPPNPVPLPATLLSNIRF
eukprot:m.161740 g.161740  ORF g.161740 m.161740 type:complete len:878 (-) comp15198_c4_seq7:19-2652(-)